MSVLSGLLSRPGRLVIGDIMSFDNPEKYRGDFDKVNYDGGDTDFPAQTDFLIGYLEEI